MAKNIVVLSPQYMPLADKGKPVSLGYIYVGEPDTDPTIVVNQKELSVLQEDGSTVVVAQPLRTSVGGLPVYDGSVVTMVVEGDYCLNVFNSHMEQIFYVPTNRLVDDPILPESCDLVVTDINTDVSDANADGSPVVLQIYDEQTVTGALVANDNITIEIMPCGGQILLDEDFTINGFLRCRDCSVSTLAFDAVDGDETLTINGGIDAGLYKIFGDDLTIATGSEHACDVWQVEWFGAKAWEESSEAIQKAFDFVSDAYISVIYRCKLVLSSTYYVSSTIILDGMGVDIECIGHLIQTAGANLTSVVKIERVSDSKLVFNIDGNRDANTAVTGLFIEDAGAREAEISGNIVECDIGCYINDDSEGYQLNLYVFDCGTALKIEGSGAGTPGRVTAFLNTKDCTIGLHTTGFSISNVHIVAHSTGQIALVEDTSEVYLSGETEGSGATGDGTALSVDSADLILKNLRIRSHLAADGWILKHDGGSVIGSLIATGATLSNGALLLGDAIVQDKLSLSFTACRIGIQFGDATHQAKYYKVQAYINSNVNESILFYNSRYIDVEVLKIAISTDGVSEPIDIADTVATDDINLIISPHFHDVNIAKAAGAARIFVLFKGYMDDTSLAAIPNVFEGMCAESYKYGAPTYRRAMIHVNFNDEWVLENYDEAIIDSGDASVVVTHNLPSAPEVVLVTAKNSTASAANVYVDTFTATEFTIKVGAALGANGKFSWWATNR